jgi:hypothetical protein
VYGPPEYLAKEKLLNRAIIKRITPDHCLSILSFLLITSPHVKFGLPAKSMKLYQNGGYNAIART